MAQHVVDKKKTTSDKVAAFISNNRVLLWVLLGVLLVSVVLFAVIDNSLTKRSESYADTAVALQDSYSKWFSAADEDKDALAESFLEQIGAIADSGKTNILVEKALFLRGQFYLQKKEWDSSYADFSKIAEISPDSYLASVGIYNAASSKENSGDIEGALSLLKSISEKYRSTSPLIPEVLFNMGRLSESLGKTSEAVAAYEDLANSYSSSSWTNLAKTRIISLKASGVSQ